MTATAPPPVAAEGPATDPTAEAGLAARLRDSPPGTRRYAVRAVWRTLQGEGFWAGRPAVFVRLAGCNLWTGEAADRDRDAARSGAACPLWCDTDFRKAGSVRLSAEALVAEMLHVAGPVRFAVLTGGEPLLQADAPLVAALRAEGFYVACETNGTQTLAGAFGCAEDGPDWIVCSPKLPEARLPLEHCDELKLVVPDYAPADFEGLAARVRPHAVAGRLLWLQPEDGPRRAEAVARAVALAHEDPAWRVSVQTHKVLGVD